MTKHSTTAQHIYFRELFYFVLNYGQLASLVAQTVKRLPAVQETWVRFLAWEDPLEEGMTTHSSILAWRLPKDRGACGPWRCKELDTAE